MKLKLREPQHLVAAFASLLAGLVLLFPPWRATFYPLERDTIPTITLSLPWPNPSFTLSGGGEFPQHEFAMFVSVFTPPRPRVELAGDHGVGVWSTSVDPIRLFAMLVADILIPLGAILFVRRSHHLKASP